MTNLLLKNYETNIAQEYRAYKQRKQAEALSSSEDRCASGYGALGQKNYIVVFLLVTEILAFCYFLSYALYGSCVFYVRYSNIPLDSF